MKTKKFTWYNLPNLLDELIGKVFNKKDDSLLEFWAGSLEEYEEIKAVDSKTLYFITEDDKIR